MQLVERHIIKRSDDRFAKLDNLCFRSKNLYNATLYAIRQHYFETKEHLLWTKVTKDFQDRNQADYIALPRKVSVYIMRLVGQNFQSFFGALKSKKAGTNDRPVKIPGYLNKTDGRYVATYTNQAISMEWLKKGFIKLSGENVFIKTRRGADLKRVCVGKDKQGKDKYEYKSEVQQVRVVPKGNHYVVEVIYNVEDVEVLPDNGRYCSIDIGVNNLAAVASNVLSPFLINGRPIKSVNHYYNEQLAKRKSQLETRYGRKSSNSIQRLTFKRNQKVDDYLHKSSRYIINQLVSNHIHTLVIGHNPEWKQEVNIGKVNNQNFTQIPHTQFIEMLKYKAQLQGIRVIVQPESYTSKYSFLDNETIEHHETYAGKRIKRGLYRSADNTLVNADINDALNILRKAVPDVTFTDRIKVCSTPILINIPKNSGVLISIKDIHSSAYTQ